MSHKLLLADDSVTIQKVVNLTFADEGIDVVTVGDGDAAVEQIAEFGPDLVMADVNMPGRSGYEVCELIKSDPSTRHIPVILLVGSFEPFDEDEARRVGADDYMTKPFQSIRQLVNKVTDLLNGTSDAAPETEVAEEPGFESAEAAPAERAVDTHADTLEMDIPPPTVDYGDAGLDDEMIEASKVDEFEATIPVMDEPLATPPLERSELKDFAFVTPASEYETENPAIDETVDAPEETAAEEFREPEPELELPVSQPTYASFDDEADSAVLETEPEPAPVSETPAATPYFAAPAPVSIDESNPLDLPPLVEETGIRAPFVGFDADAPIAPAPVAPAPAMSEEMIAEITARVADKLAERIARALDSDVVRDVTMDVLKEIDQTKDLS